MSTGRVVVVGSGPNGLTAAALLARAGLEVEVFERNPAPGGAAASSSEVLGPGTVVDLGAAQHPFGVASPAFRELELERHGLTWVHPRYPMAHPLPGRPAALLHGDLPATAGGLGADGRAWSALHRPFTERIDRHLADVLAPVLRVPEHPLLLARFGLAGMASARGLGRALFREEAARALLAGSAVHATLPPSQPLTGAFGILFSALGMSRGWPAVTGGTQGIVDALLVVLRAHGGVLHTGVDVADLRSLPPADAVVLNQTPAQVLRLQGLDLPGRVRRRLGRWRYGPGALKLDYLLDAPVPWADDRVAGAGTVHVCGTVDEIEAAEAAVAGGVMPERPFVILCQQQAADPTRATGEAAGQTVLWAYAHVPHGYVEPVPGYVAGLVEAQIERFAPGFRDVVSRRAQRGPRALEAWNPNLVGGDVANGTMGGLQSLLRPGFTTRPHRLRRGLYLASGATAPGAGAHGMPGYWAAQAVLRDLAG